MGGVQSHPKRDATATAAKDAAGRARSGKQLRSAKKRSAREKEVLARTREEKEGAPAARAKVQQTRGALVRAMTSILIIYWGLTQYVPGFELNIVTQLGTLGTLLILCSMHCALAEADPYQPTHRYVLAMAPTGLMYSIIFYAFIP